MGAHGTTVATGPFVTSTGFLTLLSPAVTAATVGDEGVDVDFRLTDDQELFRETTRRFLESECPLTEVRRLESEPAGFDADWWRRGADLGWTATLVPEEDGGGSVSTRFSAGGTLCPMGLRIEAAGR